MLPTRNRSDGKWDKWGVNNMNKVLAVVLVLLLSLQIVTWNGCSLVRIPYPFTVVDHSPPSSTPASSPSLKNDLSSVTRTNELPVLVPQVDAELKQMEAKLKQKQDKIKQKQAELKQKEVELKQKEANLKQKEDDLKRKEAELKQKEVELKQKEAILKQKEDDLKQKEAELKQKEVELKQKEAILKQKEDDLKQKEAELKQKEKLKLVEPDELNLTKEQQLKFTQTDELATPQLQLPPNSYFPDADSDIWGCRQHRVDDELAMTYNDWVTGAFTDEQALCAAHRHAKRPLAPGTPRIAFLFLAHGAIATEPIWKSFFAGHEDKYSIYVHNTDTEHEYARGSLFHNRTIPSQKFNKLKISFSEAVRRLLAYALLDVATPNAWFHVLCNSSVPVRAFPHVYDHITRSDRSFVEAFYPTSMWWRRSWVNTTLTVPDASMRKGEAWVTVHRRHAGLIVGDHYLFPRFKHHWYEWGIPSEVYIPTLLTVVDPYSVANHSLVYVDWVHSDRGTSSPVAFNASHVSDALIRGIQNLTSNANGFYQFDKMWNDTTEKSCVYNGVPDSPCFLFARKFSGEPESIAKLLSLSPVLGY